MGRRLADDEEEGFSHSYCNTIRHPRWDPRRGLRSALCAGSKGMASWSAIAALPRRRRRRHVRRAMLLSLFIRDPQFQGQTKERPSLLEATRLVESGRQGHFDHWLSARPTTARALLERSRSEPRAATATAATRAGTQDRDP